MDGSGSRSPRPGSRNRLGASDSPAIIPNSGESGDQLAKGSVAAEERVQVVTDLENLHTFSGIINRTRRRDIGAFTIRKPETVTVDFTPDQQQLHDEVLRVQAEIFSRLYGDIYVKFLMTTIRRQAASCLYGLAPFLEDILNRHIDELEWDEADDMEPVPSGGVINSIKSQIETIIEKAQSLDPYDPKLEALRKIIRDKQNLSNNKIMLFSSFRHTLSYLDVQLRADGVRVGMIHGGTPDEERVALAGAVSRNRARLATVLMCCSSRKSAVKDWITSSATAL